MPSRLQVAVCAVVLAIALAGCASGFSLNDDRSSETIRTDTLAAMDEVETYTFNASLEVTSGGGLPIALMANASGAVDTTNERLYSTLSVPTRGETQTYIIGETVYTNDSNGWSSRQLSTNYFEAGTPIETHKQTLENATVDHEGTEEIGGRTVNVLAVSIEDADVRTLLRSLLGEANATAIQADTGDILENATIETADIRYYTGVKDDRIYRVTVDGTISAVGRTATVSLNMDFDNYGEDVSIELPPAAPATP